MKAIIHILFSLIVLLSWGVQFLSGVSAQQDDERRLKAVTRRDGWEIPGLRGSRLTSREEWPWNEDAGKARIFLSILRPRGGAVLLEERAHYYLREDGSLRVDPVAIRTASIRRYDVEGKPFVYAYFGIGIRVGKDDDGRKHLITLGCSGGAVYYDDDGDGKFERFEALLGAEGFKPRIPEWVRNYVPATPQHNKAVQLTER